MQRLLTEFQPDAVEIEQRSVPGGARWTLYVVCLLLASTVGWACWAQVDRIVVAPGKLVTNAPLLIPGASTSAPIRSVNVRFGQTVKRGDVLATLDPELTDADVRQVEFKMATVEANLARLLCEQNGSEFSITGHEASTDWQNQLQLFRERQHEYRAKMEEFASELTKLEVQKKSSQTEQQNSENRSKRLGEYFETVRGLYAKGNESRTTYLSAELQVKDEETKVAAHINRQLEIDSESDVVSKKRNAFVAGWRADVADSIQKSSDEMGALREELNKARTKATYTNIVVPMDSDYSEYYVLEVADRNLGSVVQQGEAMFKLAPLGAAMEVEMEISERDRGRVKIGDLVIIKLTAFPYQKHGYLRGHIVTISEGSEVPREQGGAAPKPPHYRARVAIENPAALENVDSDFRLVPDMAAECEVKIGTRRVIEFFLYPLWRAFDNSIREP